MGAGAGLPETEVPETEAPTSTAPPAGVLSSGLALHLGSMSHAARSLHNARQKEMTRSLGY